MAAETTAEGKPVSKAEREVTKWEWLIAVVSAIVVIASVGYVFYRAVTNDNAPPDIDFTIERIVPTRSGYVLEFWVYNYGGITAKDLTVEAELTATGEEPVVRSTAFLFVPDGSRRRGGVFFPVDPRRYDLRLYPVGYDYP